MRSVNILFHLLLLSFFFSTAFASTANIEITGTTPGFIPFDKPVVIQHNGKTQIINGKHVQYMRVRLSPEGRDWLKKHLDEPYMPATDNQQAVQTNIGMNGVPVLDQGDHGSCVTFAITGNLDAMYGQGDYISQLCNLSLGKYLNKTIPDYPSGWDGTLGRRVLTQIKQYGIHSMQSQRSYGCAGVRKYPRHNSGNTGKPMSETEFKLHSEDLMRHISWIPIINFSDAFSSRMNGPNLLQNVKRALNRGNRVVYGFFLLSKNGDNGARGKFRTNHDSWVMTKKIANDLTTEGDLSAHEIIITGYDDNAVISGPDCTYHRGVVTIRNSWGKKVGDHGDYYMSYEYLTKMIVEAYELIPA